MSLTRRRVLVFSAAFAVPALGISRLARAQPLSDALKSGTVYLSPLKSDGSESTCHGEVWFVLHDGSLFVSTASDAWRAEAVRNGLVYARLWLGEHGVWTKPGESFKASPNFLAKAELVSDRGVHESVLTNFGEKYSGHWGSWGPRFEQGLQDGTRVLLKYSRHENGSVVPLK